MSAMNATTWSDRARNAFLYALVTTIMVLGVASVLSAYAGAAQRALADRVDNNAAAIICILQLGVDEKAPPRTQANVDLCLADPTWVDGESP